MKALEQRVARMETDEDFVSTHHKMPAAAAGGGGGASSAEVSEVARAASRIALFFLFRAVLTRFARAASGGERAASARSRGRD